MRLGNEEAQCEIAFFVAGHYVQVRPDGKRAIWRRTQIGDWKQGSAKRN